MSRENKKTNTKKKLILLIFFCYIVLITVSFFRPLVMRYIMDEGLMVKKNQIVITCSIILLVLALIEEGIKILQVKLCTDLQNNIVINLFSKIFQRLLYAKINYFSKNNTTEIINRLSTDINSITSLVDSGMINILSYMVQIVSGVCGLIIINWKLAIVVLVVIPIKYLLILFFSVKKEEGIRVWLEENTRFLAWFDDTINGIKEIKLWNLYKKKQKELKSRKKRVLELEKKNILLETYNTSGDLLLQEIVLSVLYGVGGYLICKDSLSIGSLMAFISYSNYVIGPISLIMNIRLTLAQIQPSSERLHDFLKLESEKMSKTGYHITKFQEMICFRNVEFSYNDKTLIKNINFEIHRGEKIAIIGDNGSGKSTLISLLLRFLSPNKGEIYIDGKKIEDYNLEDYRNLFGVIHQNIYLFRDTLKNNISMNKEISDDYIEKIFKKMNMQNFVNELPRGYYSMLDKNGENMSGGERQKIAFIRAIVKDSPIMIMDEATANVDKAYDEFLHYNILKEFSDKTFIIITHKKENLEGMDAIYEIKNHTLIKR